MNLSRRYLIATKQVEGNNVHFMLKSTKFRTILCRSTQKKGPKTKGTTNWDKVTCMACLKRYSRWAEGKVRVR